MANVNEYSSVPDNSNQSYQAIWTKLQQTTQRETSYAVALDSKDMVIVGGYTLGNLNGITSLGASDGFISKYSTNGDLQWSRLVGGPGGDAVAAVGTDKNNNIFALVGVNSDYLADPVPAAGVSGTSYKIVKFNESGKLLSEIEIQDNLAPRSLSVTPEGDVLVTGSLGMWPNVYLAFFKADHIDSGSASPTGSWKDTQMSFGSPSNSGVGSTFSDKNFYIGGSAGSRAFVTKYSLAGGQEWFKFIEPINFRSEINAVANDRHGSIYVAGFSGEIPDSGYTPGKVLDNSTQPNTYQDRERGRVSSDSLLAKYDDSGNLLWLKQFGTDADDSADAIAVDSFGNVYVGGYTGRTYGNTAIVATDAKPYIKVFNSNGDAIWTKILEGSVGHVLSMTSDSSGFIHAAGMAEGSLNGETALTGSGRNGFLMKLAYLTGTESNDVLRGSIGNDEIYSLDGDDTVYAGLGDDLIIGSDDRGNDRYDGGRGLDTADYSEKTAAVSVILSGSRWADVRVGGVREDRIKNIENITGGSGDDSLIGDRLSNVLTGGAGDDVLNGGTGNDVLNGGTGNDVLDGGAGTDTLTGGAGNDVLNGGAGNDTLTGGQGDDTYDVDSLSDVIVEAAGQGVDLIRTSLRTADLNNYLNVEDLTYTGRSGSTLTGNAANNVITGGVGADIIAGGAGADTLNGGSGSDLLDGGAGNDDLHGGLGRDRLTGGAGADKFVFDTAPNTRTNADIITDFRSSEGDELVFDDSIFTMLSGGVTVTKLRINTTGRAQDTDDFLILNSNNGKLFYDADGSGRGAAVEIATLTGVNTLTHDDFFII